MHKFYFTIEREIDGENTDIELVAECEIAAKCATIETIYEFDEDGKHRRWAGSLTSEEEEQIEQEAYEDWLESATEAEEDDCLLDSEYDSFHDERAINIGGAGKVYY